MYTQHMYNDSLAHHGILGQKWGVRNGPPYPLGYEAHSKAEKKANPKTRIDGKSDTNNKHLTAKQKQILKGVAIGAGIATVAGLSAYAYYTNPAIRASVDRTIVNTRSKAVNSLNIQKIKDKVEIGENGRPIYKTFANGQENPMASYGISLQKNSALYGKRSLKDKIDDLKYTNKNAKGIIIDRSHNCFKCATNMELRARGIDSIAQVNTGPNSNSMIHTLGHIKSSFKLSKDQKNELIAQMERNIEPSEFLDTLRKQPKGSRGIVAADLLGSSDGAKHFFNYEITKKGKLIFKDGYSSQIIPTTAFSNNVDDLSRLRSVGNNANKSLKGKIDDLMAPESMFKTDKIIFFRTDDKELNWDYLAKNMVEPNLGGSYNITRDKHAEYVQLIADAKNGAKRRNIPKEQLKKVAFENVENTFTKKNHIAIGITPETDYLKGIFER